jgi:hypothetical protein
MSKLARALTFATMLAALQLAAMTTAAQAYATNQPSGQADATVRRLLARERSSIPNQTPAQPAADAAHPRLLLAEQRSSLLNLPNRASAQAAADATLRRLLARERYYSTWDYGDTSAPAPAEPSGHAGWLTPALGVLAAALALVAGVAVLVARRANRSQRASQTA